METTKESCEISIQQEDSTPAEQYPQTITVQEVPSETREGTEVAAYTRKRDEGNAAGILTTTGHEPVNSETVTDDVSKDEDTKAASSTYTADRVKVIKTTKENCETSIRQEENPQTEQYPQIITIEEESENDD